LIARSRARSQLPAACASYVAIRGRSDLSVVEPETGKVRWSRDDLPRAATVVGTDSTVYILPREGSRRMALRAIDGEPAPIGQAGKWLPHAVAAVGDRLLTVVAEEPPFRLFNLPIGRRSVVSLRDPLTGEAAWTRSFPADTLFDLSPDGRLCALTSEGVLSSLDPASGEPLAIGHVPAEVLRGRSEVYLLADSKANYIVVNSGRGPSFFAADMPAIPVGGHIFAFRRDGGELLWRREVSNHRLLTQEFEHMPVILFTESERTDKAGQGLWKVNLLALDKRTGEPALDEPYYTTSTPFFRGLAVQPERRSIELTAYHTRLRLQAVPVQPEQQAAPAAKDAAD
jgi:hypothetical protein